MTLKEMMEDEYTIIAKISEQYGLESEKAKMYL
jgi:hypothetical protein